MAMTTKENAMAQMWMVRGKNGSLYDVFP